MPENLSEIAASLRERMDATHAVREEALALSRKIIQGSSKAIKCVHRKQFDEAGAIAGDTGEIVRRLMATVEAHGQFRFGALVQDAIKEYVEACVFMALVKENGLPSPRELGVEDAAYLNGLCEAASECRRFALDAIRLGDAEFAFRLCDAMEDVYDELITFDYPDAVTGNLRRNVDSLRAVLERTRSDLAVTAMQRELIEQLKAANEPKT